MNNTHNVALSFVWSARQTLVDALKACVRACVCVGDLEMRSTTLVDWLALRSYWNTTNDTVSIV